MAVLTFITSTTAAGPNDLQASFRKHVNSSVTFLPPPWWIFYLLDSRIQLSQEKRVQLENASHKFIISMYTMMKLW